MRNQTEESQKKKPELFVGLRGTVDGFRPLVGAECWAYSDYTKSILSGEVRPRLRNEPITGSGMTLVQSERGFFTVTSNPLPSPNLPVFRAFGELWYRHVPGDLRPTLDKVYAVFRDGRVVEGYTGFFSWEDTQSPTDIVGWRFSNHETQQPPDPLLMNVGNPVRKMPLWQRIFRALKGI